MTDPDPVPDISQPGPSFGDAFRAFAPPGTDMGALMQSLKGARRAEIPLDLKWCHTCQRTHSGSVTCPEMGDAAGEGSGQRGEILKAARVRYRGRQHEFDQLTPAPADPFTPGRMAGAALAEFYDDLVASGIPVASVERILGAMLAAHAANQEGE